MAVFKLSELSKRQAKQFGKKIRFMADGKLPWKIGILIDATLQNVHGYIQKMLNVLTMVKDLLSGISGQILYCLSTMY